MRRAVRVFVETEYYRGAGPHSRFARASTCGHHRARTPSYTQSGAREIFAGKSDVEMLLGIAGCSAHSRRDRKPRRAGDVRLDDALIRLAPTPANEDSPGFLGSSIRS